MRLRLQRAAASASAAVERRGVLVVASVGCVAASAIYGARGRGPGTWALTLLALAVAARAAGARSFGQPSAPPARVWAITGAGVGMYLAAAAAPPDNRWFDIAFTVASLTSLAAALLALREIPSTTELSAAASRPSVRAVSILVALAHVAAIALVADHQVRRAEAPAPLVDTVAIGAPIVGILGVAVAFAHAASERRLELGILERLRGSIGPFLLSLLLAFVFLVVGVDRGVRAVSFASVFGGLSITWAASHADPVALVRRSRLVLAIVLVGGPLLTIGALLAEGRVGSAPPIVWGTGALAIAVGLAAGEIADEFRPARGAWLDAVERGHRALRAFEPSEALRETLVAIRAPAGASSSSPELWTFDPPRALTIDAAGYAHERAGELPPGLLRLAEREPEATLRSDLLDALVVRRPEIRTLAQWMTDHGVLAATLVAQGGDVEGVLLFARGTRGELLTLEEARAFKGLADAIAPRLHDGAALRRSLDRERQTTRAKDAALELLARKEHALTVVGGRHEATTARLARAASIGVYSAASRLAYEAIERKVSAGAPLLVLTPSGVDPVAYLARAHLASPRRDTPFVVVDATETRSHDEARWRDKATSPIAAADGGMLVVVDVGALPKSVQRFLARTLAERRGPWDDAEPLAVTLAVTSVPAPDVLRHESRLDAELAARLSGALDTPVVLPRLRDRPEDIRAILVDRLARIGLRVRGAPVGIEDKAFAKLVEYDFPGEDAEVTLLAERLVAVCEGEVVGAADVVSVFSPLTSGAVAWGGKPTAAPEHRRKRAPRKKG